MEETFARKGLIAPERLRLLSGRSDGRAWLQVLSHFGAIGLSGLGIHLAWGSAWVVAPFLLHGVLINYLYAGQHELSHSTAFKTRGLNEGFGRLIGFILITPRDADQIQHFAHHRHTQRWREDGELFRDRFTLASYLLRLSGLEYWHSNAKSLALYGLGVVTEPYVLQADGRGRVVLEARLHLLGYGLILAASIWLHSAAALIYWLAPMLLTKAAHQLQNTIEHVGLPHSDNIFENTRSTRTNMAMRWLCWNMPYHTAHHAFPSVPFYRLAALHDEVFVARGMVPPTMSYLGFQAGIIRALAAKDEADYPDNEVWVGEGLRRTNQPVAA